MTDELVTVRGRVRRRMFYNQDDGFCIVLIDVASIDRGKSVGGRSLGVKGRLRGIEEGMDIKAQGRFVEHAKYGRQLQADLILPEMQDLEGVYRYLLAGGISGVGKKLAGRIAETFGAGALEIIRREPERLLEIEGIGKAKAAEISAALAEQKSVEEIMTFLLGAGLETRIANRIHRELGDQALSHIKANPYILAGIAGIGFATADDIARSLGIAPDAPARIEAGLEYVVSEAMRRAGHTRFPRDYVAAQAARGLALDRNLVSQGIERMIASGQFRLSATPSGPMLAQARVARLERRIAEQLLALAGESGVDVPKARIAATAPITLAAEQLAAVEGALRERVCVITGGPGTGKSTITDIILTLLQREAGCASIALAAPTGRAARRLAEATGRDADTLHRLLMINPENGESSRDDAIEADVLLVDEFSMVDTVMAGHLLDAIAAGTRLILIGDVDQLPSVGAGQVLADIIESGALPVFRLAHVFRNAGDIKLNAAEIRQGRMPVLDTDASSNFRFVETMNPDAGSVVAVVRRMIETDGIPATDIQVLAPMYREAAGVDAINAALQSALVGDPQQSSRKLVHGRTAFMLGDRVVQTANRSVTRKDGSTTRINNGDVGYITEMNAAEGSFKVDFDGEVIAMTRGDLIDLSLAYCVTIHKSQGSEYRGVVLLCALAHGYMLKSGRRLVYTGMTRARERLYWVGEREAAALAVSDVGERPRQTGLRAALADCAAGRAGESLAEAV
ncbi:exodeoxyribonuclease V alpha subunit [Natronocella acetinitrilica]|uniref:ATP-dependent RecD2 DNA helicase n=1 Tax=Natronocella acetinitrilica TaxID=414046 RepID=A0AAE3G2K3_9GAMM|nr:exodeoxyribonuclease V alpha subunit [Natronocella acetinitrilica]